IAGRTVLMSIAIWPSLIPVRILFAPKTTSSTAWSLLKQYIISSASRMASAGVSATRALFRANGSHFSALRFQTVSLYPASAQGNGERAENDRECQGPEAELDFQHGPGGTAADETGYAGEGHACPASGFGELVGVSPATSERR